MPPSRNFNDLIVLDESFSRLLSRVSRVPVNTQTLDGYVLNDLSARLFVVERDGALYAFDMLSY